MRSFNLSEFKYWPQVIVLALLLIGYVAYYHFAYHDTRSNDAYLSAPLVNMASLVSGPITKVYVQDNQKVKKGEKLIEIDPLPYRYALQKAQAQLNNAKQPNEILRAQAEIDKANYFLQHTILVAPDEGYITNFNMQEGQYVAEGEGLFAFINNKKWWVITLYRETALRLIKPGDKAIIKIDMYPGKVFHGHVQSISWGINRVQKGDAAASTLVYLETTENWIRIAQRFPVRISIDDVSDEYPLRIGASASTATYR
jgi:membrane fusion protein (multidrug efflux system)